MKKKILLPLLCVILAMVMLFGITGCPSMGTSSSAPSVTTPAEAPGVVTLVKSKWSSGDLIFTQNDGTAMLTFDGSAGDVEIATATITGGTLSGTFSGSPAFSGTPTFANHALGSANITASGTTVTVTHGLGSTPSFIFISFHDDPLTSSNLTSPPVPYPASANATSFVITIPSSVTSNNTLQFDWLAFLNDE